MKLSSAVVLASAMASTVSATAIRKGKNIAQVLKHARRVEENQQEEEEQEGEYDYLMNYSLKLVQCKSGETVINAENGEYEYSAVVVRLCPSDAGCSDDIATGCSAGYGDFVVGLNTFVDAYFEDQKDNMQWDDAFEVDRYAQCEEYEVEAAEDDANANAYENYQFFIGPTCAEDGLDVKLALFEDEACSYASEFSFETISNGWSLPYEDGGLVSTSCIDCVQYNDDGEYEAREMCEQTYMQSTNKCETNMEYYSYYGQNTQGCEYITEIMPAQKSGGNGGKVFGWIVFIALVVGIAGYIMWWRKKKSAGAELA